MPIYSPTGFLDITNATLRTSNVEAENLLMTGGNIYVTSELETDATVLNLENVTRKGNVSSNTIEITNATTGIVATGNVQASKFIGSGEYLTGIPPSAITGTLSQWSDGTNGDVYIAGGVGIANAHTLTSNTLQVGGNLYVRDTGSNVLTVDGNVVANYFEGDGSKLSGIVTDLQGVTDNGNTTTNVVQFSNVTTGLVTTANIEVGGDLKIDGLTAGKIPYVAADKFLKDSFITTTGDTTVITSNLDVTGNIFMRGDKFIVHSESKLINDAIVGIANNNTVSTTDKGIIMQNTAGNVAIIHHGTGDGFADQLTFGYTDDPLDTVTVTNDLTKELTVNVLGNVITQNNLSVGGTLSINNITAAAQHSLQAVTNVGNVTSNTVQFSNAITSLTASSNIVVTGNVSAGHNTNTTSYFGRAAVGYMGQDDQASFAHVDHNDPARYAIKQTAAGPTYINTPAAGHIRFTVNDGNAGAEKMRITSAGRVGVGTTSPDNALHIRNAIPAVLLDDSDDDTKVRITGGAGGSLYVDSNWGGSGNTGVIIFREASSEKMRITGSGNVGVGTTSPSAKLHINSSSGSDGIAIFNPNGGTGGNLNVSAGVRGGILISNAGGGSNATDKYSSQPIILNGGGTSATNGNLRGGSIWSMWGGSQYGLAFKGASNGDAVPEGGTDPNVFITSDKVGIGTHAPGAKLEIGHYGNAIGDLTALRMTNHATDLHGTVLTEYNLVVSDIASGTGLGNGHFSIAYRDDKTDNLSHRLRIAGNGNVGITLQHPRTRLHVGNLLTTAHSDRETIPQSNLGINADFPRTTSAWFAHRTTDTQQDYWGLAVGTLYSGDSYLQNLNKNSTAYYNLLLQRHGGFVGIRNTDPYCPLHVSGSGGSTTGATWHSGFIQGNTVLQRWSGNHTNVGIFADDDIMTTGYVLSTGGTFGASDRRIKKDIVDIDDGMALQTLRQLQPKQYKYKDVYRNTSDPVWGFIAQEVRETLPHSTQLRNECIPNITEVVTVSETNVLTFTNFDTSNLETGTKIRVYDKNHAGHKVKVTDIIDTRSVRIDRDISEWTCSFNEDGTIGEGDSLYVYGQEVDDFVFIKKDAIWTVATAALQEVDRQLQAEKTKVATLETQLASVLARLDALENA